MSTIFSSICVHWICACGKKDDFVVLIAWFHVNLLGPGISNGLVMPLPVVCKWEVYHDFVLGQALVNNGYGYASIVTLKLIWYWDMQIKGWLVVLCHGSSVWPFWWLLPLQPLGTKHYCTVLCPWCVHVGWKSGCGCHSILRPFQDYEITYHKSKPEWNVTFSLVIKCIFWSLNAIEYICNAKALPGLMIILLLTEDWMEYNDWYRCCPSNSGVGLLGTLVITRIHFWYLSS